MSPKKTSQPWADRIVGYEPAVDPSQLLAHELNARRHPGAQRDALRSSLDRVGWVDVVKVNRRNGKVVDGHARVEEALTSGDNVPVLYVDLDDDEERYVLATLDPISALATYDTEVLDELVAGLELESSAVSDWLENVDEYTPGDLVGGLGDPPEELGPEKYTRRSNVPIYEIKGTKPPVEELTDRERSQSLLTEIDAAEELPDDVREFLTAAAFRHVVFDYARIAEFYAHATPDLQRLMEASALVIVDYDDAIRSGFVRFSEELGELRSADLLSREQAVIDGES